LINNLGYTIEHSQHTLVGLAKVVTLLKRTRIKTKSSRKSLGKLLEPAANTVAHRDILHLLNKNKECSIVKRIRVSYRNFLQLKINSEAAKKQKYIKFILLIAVSLYGNY